MSEIGASFQEVMESYEVEIKGKVYPVKSVKNLTGHNIKPYMIHGDKQVPFVKNTSRQIMEEGDIFAIETFGSTGKGYMMDDVSQLLLTGRCYSNSIQVGVYGYGRQAGASAANLHNPSAKGLLKKIDENFGTIVFCRRYLERLGVKNYLPAVSWIGTLPGISDGGFWLTTHLQ
jgi:methionyl aminopeptidase